jgi:Zn-dependent peptidase ImmA (M78 family)
MAIANYISRKRQSQIDAVVDQIQLDTDKSYPENSLIEIIKSYIPNVSIVEHDFYGDHKVRGAIYKMSKVFKTPLIVVQKKLSKEGKTFALAHEFGHYCLDHVGSANFMFDRVNFDDSAAMQKEAEANYFAGSLLMPRDEFIKLMNFLSIKELAQRFGVSESAARVRKAWLDGSGRDKTL